MNAAATRLDEPPRAVNQLLHHRLDAPTLGAVPHRRIDPEQTALAHQAHDVAVDDATHDGQCSIKTPEHDKFLTAYQRKWKEYPRLGSIVGYSTMMSIAAGIKKAGSTDTEKLITAMRGLQVDSPLGKFTYRAIDHQATMGAYVGVTAVNQGRGVMRDFRYIDGTAVLPSDAEIRKLRPADAMQ
jgi:ABC-type branched-subunit amino acid transport system substrate-binding protein